MKTVKKPFAFLVVCMCVLTALQNTAFAHRNPEPKTGAHSRQMAGRVKQEFLYAWRNYEKYAWGHDALRPLSKTPHDWYGESLLMTPVDALDTLILMGLNDEANRVRELIAT